MQSNTSILPPQTIGIIGGGQLGRMMAIAAKYMGYRVIVLDPTPNCPTSQVSDGQIVAAYDDMNAIKELTDKSDVVTYEFENVDLEAATFIEEQGKLPQGAYALEVTQNREKEKTVMKALQLPVPDFFIVHNGKACQEALKEVSFPVVMKTCRGGYDGKGQLKLESEADIPNTIQFVEQNGHCIIETWLSFDKEISVVFTRDAKGAIEFFPIAENVHKDHILFQTTAPAKVSTEVQRKAYEAATLLANKIEVVGTFAIEMFVSGNNIYLNEMAPRPHNSGHYTIEACNISQFAQHIRAICGLPLIPVKLLEPSAMINILGEDVEPTLKAMVNVNQGFIHLYGKAEAKAKRKMGHITFIGEDSIEQVKQFEEAKQ
ncbi:5-(carboxyamino)imidazole ribonucleotide synthase [Ornithinibacillus massiliensis]|uniref:N5-carboxyaminoimidazole ribonucleotide synthase n=1 Tax=Ornithinibacillus massiliensis TaxID=1944633 RepID=A0ABS5MFP2_9BACI|nr:5-(carboxyamino)imidazole ribonucleotide synthase [Ornithinibacillus massiliensis]MBS3681156.1 5-(carboxyamino)imidazole ribonucleotide synthase [Ornithinibacillus massiliensis]